MATAAPSRTRRKAMPHREARLTEKYADRVGVIDVARLASGFFINRSELARSTGLPATTLSKKDRSKGAKAQARLREMLEVLERIEDWAGGETQALSWYRSQPIPALNGRTAEALVQSGEAAAVRSYLDHLALGGYA